MKRFLLVHYRSVRVARRPDGLYAAQRFGSRMDARRYLDRFERRARAMDEFRSLLEALDENLNIQDLDDLELLDEVSRRIDKQEVVVAEMRSLWHGITALDDDEIRPSDDPIPPPKPPKPKLDWIQIQVVDDQTGRPINNVRLVVRTPDQLENYHTTNSEGSIRIENLPPGSCDIWCELKEAKLADTLMFVRTGEAPVDKKPLEGGRIARALGRANRARRYSQGQNRRKHPEPGHGCGAEVAGPGQV